MDSQTVAIIYSIFVVVIVALLFLFFDGFANYSIMKNAGYNANKKFFVPFLRYVEVANILHKEGKLSSMSFSFFKFMYLVVFPILNLTSLFYSCYKISRVPEFMQMVNSEELYFEETAAFMGVLVITFGFMLLNLVLSKLTEIYLRTQMMGLVFSKANTGERLAIQILYGFMILLGSVITTISTVVCNIIYTIQFKNKNGGEHEESSEAENKKE